jgi:hypothetical protein
VNCKVVIAGIVRVGDTITKEPIVTNEPMSE